MKNKFIFIVVLLILLSTTLNAKTWYVKPDSTGEAINIQAGIDSSVAGDTVLVAPGIFRGDGNRDLDFKGKEIVVIAECRYDTTITDSTVIDCEGTQQDPHRGFYFHSGEDSLSVLEGFVIENGYIHYETEDLGGAGICCDSSSCPTIINNTVRNCHAFALNGGGIFCKSSSPIINNNVICHNIKSGMPEFGGGGIYCYESSSSIIGNEIYDNQVDGWHNLGGGIACVNCSLITIKDNNIYLNSETAEGAAGAIAMWNSSALIENNIIADNSAQTASGIGGRESSLTIINNQIHDNHASWGGGGIYLINCAANISNNILQTNHSGGLGCGGGICIEGGSITVSDNIINNNSTGIEGGGICITGAVDTSSVIRDNIISDNYNGGIYCSSSITIINNRIIGNINSYQGGGIICYSSDPLIIDNLITYNLCSHYGGAIYCESASPKVFSNTIVGNFAGRGNGIYCDSQSSPIIKCNIVANNFIYPIFYYDGAGIYTETSSLIIECCDIYNNEGGNYIGIPDQTGINGNISSDPYFCDPPNGIYSLASYSPCLPGNHPDGCDCGLIGACGWGCEAVSTLLQNFSTEYSGNAIAVKWKLVERLNSCQFYVLRSEEPFATYNEISNPVIIEKDLLCTFLDNNYEPGISYRYRIDILDERGRRMLFETDPISTPSLALTLYQNYPNPFNPSTMIKYYLLEKSYVRLTIYDVRGRKITCLVNKELTEGVHIAEWDGRDINGNTVSSGIYFYRLTAGKETISKKMVLLR